MKTQSTCCCPLLELEPDICDLVRVVRLATRSMASGLEADDGQESLEDTYLILLHAEQRTLALKAKFYAEDQKGRAQAAEAAHV